MNLDKVQNWIRIFFGSQTYILKQKKNKKFSKITKIYKNLNLNHQSLSLFQQIIFETVWKIGDECRKNHIYKFNLKINQYNVLKGFTRSNTLKDGSWIFKFRKYFSKFYIQEKFIKDKKKNIASSLLNKYRID